MISFFIAWLGVMFSLVFSPGPANILLAAAGARQGFTKTLPVLLGIDLIFVLKSFLIGFGLAEIFQQYPMILIFVQIFGVAYLIWLSWVFIKPKPQKKHGLDSRIGFKEGVVLQFFNAKGWLMVALMFSLFSKSAIALWDNYSTAVLILLLAVLNVVLHMLWILIGATIGHFNSSHRFEKNMNVFFAASLFLTAIWLAWSAI